MNLPANDLPHSSSHLGNHGLVATALCPRKGATASISLNATRITSKSPPNNPRRSYIDITGHGLNAAQRIDITDRFDNELIGFRGIKMAPAAWFQHAAELFDRVHPLLRHFPSDAMVAAFSQRENLPTGKSKRCSSFVVDRVSLLGDAGAPMPPVAWASMQHRHSQLRLIFDSTPQALEEAIWVIRKTYRLKTIDVNS